MNRKRNALRILQPLPRTRSHYLQGVSHANDLDFAKGASYKQPRFAWGCPYQPLGFANDASYKKVMICRGFPTLIIWILPRVSRTSSQDLQTVSKIASYSGRCAFKILKRTDARTSLCNINHRYENPLIKLLHRGFLRRSHVDGIRI